MSQSKILGSDPTISCKEESTWRKPRHGLEEGSFILHMARDFVSPKVVPLCWDFQAQPLKLALLLPFLPVPKTFVRSIFLSLLDVFLCYLKSFSYSCWLLTFYLVQLVRKWLHLPREDSLKITLFSSSLLSICFYNPSIDNNSLVAIVWKYLGFDA